MLPCLVYFIIEDNFKVIPEKETKVDGLNNNFALKIKSHD